MINSEEEREFTSSGFKEAGARTALAFQRRSHSC